MAELEKRRRSSRTKRKVVQGKASPEDSDDDAEELVSDGDEESDNSKERTKKQMKESKSGRQKTAFNDSFSNKFLFQPPPTDPKEQRPTTQINKVAVQSSQQQRDARQGWSIRRKKTRRSKKELEEPENPEYFVPAKPKNIRVAPEGSAVNVTNFAQLARIGQQLQGVIICLMKQILQNKGYNVAQPEISKTNGVIGHLVISRQSHGLEPTTVHVQYVNCCKTSPSPYPFPLWLIPTKQPEGNEDVEYDFLWRQNTSYSHQPITAFSNIDGLLLVCIRCSAVYDMAQGKVDKRMIRGFYWVRKEDIKRLSEEQNTNLFLSLDIPRPPDFKTHGSMLSDNYVQVEYGKDDDEKPCQCVSTATEHLRNVDINGIRSESGEEESEAGNQRGGRKRKAKNKITESPDAEDQESA